MHTQSTSLVVASRFIEATRDSGYKSLGSALAELIDNAFEAKATDVRVLVEKADAVEAAGAIVKVSDNGLGMDEETCHNALRFGWSSRFNQRDSFGRYGMGLPSASLSHARRVEVFSSNDARAAALAYLDADEFRDEVRVTLPEAKSLTMSAFHQVHPFDTGTTVVWRKCDRLENRKFGPLTRRLRLELGRLFRYQLWAGKTITVNGEKILGLDPLFERACCGLSGAKPYGPESVYEVNGPAGRASRVRVRFTELPVTEWHGLSNQEKNCAGIAKRAGISVVRAEREIDFGWFFMGQKRRENYDDWWRCEVLFEPELDELFGVTHTKQEIHPTEALSAILTPDMEKIARELNARVRKAFIEVKNSESRRESEAMAERHDSLIEPPPGTSSCDQKKRVATRQGARGLVAGLEYRLLVKKVNELWFFEPELDDARLRVVLNERHPFVRKGWLQAGPQGNGAGDCRRDLELLILAAARAELMVGTDKKSKTRNEQYRKIWSNVLATFLS